MRNTAIETSDWLRNMETILDELNEGVAIIDDQLRVVFANEALRRLGPYEPAEMQGRTPLGIFPEKDIPAILCR